MKKSNLVRGMFVGVLLFLGVQGPVATASTLQDIQNEQQEIGRASCRERV